jgi:tritrans,polycis-undecaprenyl-diphosphate synthase [geranylgeranyl-diphosphate specific]
MLDRINILKPLIPQAGKKRENLKHIAVSLAETKFFDKTRFKVDELLQKRNQLVEELISMQVKHNIPIMTIYLLGNKELQNSMYIEQIMNYLAELFESFASNALISNNKIKIFTLGKWYDLSGRLVDGVKNTLDKTKEYDNFFLNFCINYDGQDEIVDAAKILARKVKYGKIDIDDITGNEIKDNLYSSYFIPPDKIYIPSKRKRLLSFMLWDASFSKIIFINRDWYEISAREIIEDN